MARARTRLQGTGLFAARDLDFGAIAAAGDGKVTALQPQGKRVGAQLPQQRATA
jgi:hypothetical protein